MLHDLDTTIAALLQSELPDTLAETGQVSFDPPNQKLKLSEPGVNLFLYDVRENRALRSNEWGRTRREGGAVVLRRAPVRVDCAYLITAHANSANGEHQLLGSVMRALLRHPSIPRQFLRGALAEVEAELPTSSLQASSTLGLGDFWQAMGGEPRAALTLTVTISVDPFDPPAPVQPVLDHIVAIGQRRPEEG